MVDIDVVCSILLSCGRRRVRRTALDVEMDMEGTEMETEALAHTRSMAPTSKGVPGGITTTTAEEVTTAARTTRTMGTTTGTKAKIGHRETSAAARRAAGMATATATAIGMGTTAVTAGTEPGAAAGIHPGRHRLPANDPPNLNLNLNLRPKYN